MSITRYKVEEQPVVDIEFIEAHNAVKTVRKSYRGDESPLVAEAVGLQALAETNTVATPAIISHWEQELVIEWIEDCSPQPSSWTDLAESLAALHAAPVPSFGFTIDTYCGPTRQPNPLTQDGHDFYAEQRYLYQGGMARDRGLLNRNDMEALERLIRRLPVLLPNTSPALLHGDLWRGNVLFRPTGEPVLIDPAAYWGWPEAEIAMTQLFGGFDVSFYERYTEIAQPQSGWQERVPLHNLYHLLNHLNIFGGSYLGQCREVLARFS